MRRSREDRLLRVLLESVQNFDVGLEWFLTAARATLLQQAAQADALTTDDQSLTFYCALARQCFINEYVFAYPPNEADEVRRLQERLSAALASGAPVPPLWVAALAAYVPLHTLPFADALLAPRLARCGPRRAAAADQRAGRRSAPPRRDAAPDQDRGCRLAGGARPI